MECLQQLSYIIKNDERLHGTSVLQVGARPGKGWKRLFDVFEENGYTKRHVLEIHAPNVVALRDHTNIQKIVQGDIRKIDKYKELDSYYDIITFWHGPEHITKKEFKNTIPLIMAKCNAFIIGAPWGKWPQGSIGGNPHEVHKTSWYPKDWEESGFNVYTFNTSKHGKGPDKLNVMFGIKYK